tara:strand:+ start:329 stop:715 length:387 start_codon:yes stop_codon:yes gene_type:complete
MKTKYIIYLLCSILLTSGCAKVEGLLKLKRLGDNQAQIERYLYKQLKLFEKLVEDINNSELKAGISRRNFIRSYGDPVLSRIDKADPDSEILLYRHPTEYFKTDKVYAYFSKSKELIRWEYIPYKEPE